MQQADVPGDAHRGVETVQPMRVGGCGGLGGGDEVLNDIHPAFHFAVLDVIDQLGVDWPAPW